MAPVRRRGADHGKCGSMTGCGATATTGMRAPASIRVRHSDRSGIAVDGGRVGGAVLLGEVVGYGLAFLGRDAVSIEGVVFGLRDHEVEEAEAVLGRCFSLQGDGPVVGGGERDGMDSVAVAATTGGSSPARTAASAKRRGDFGSTSRSIDKQRSRRLRWSAASDAAPDAVSRWSRSSIDPAIRVTQRRSRRPPMRGDRAVR